jgi:hypothetical protein
MKEEIKIPDSYYDNLKYNIKVDITGEGIDTAQKSQAYQLMAQIAGQNPTAFDNPITARIFAKWFETLGVSPIDIPVQRKSLQDIIGAQRGQVGGSLPAPQQAPVMATPQTQVV